MEFEELIRRRYSVRGYRPDTIEPEKLRQVLEAARLAPTAHNKQPLRLVVVHTAGRHEELNRIYPRTWFAQAPIVVGVCAFIDQGWLRRDGKSYIDVDAAIVMDHLILAATNAGLGSCWIANFDPAAAREVLELPEGVDVIAFTPLGYPAAERKPTTRKALGELVSYERWQQTEPVSG